MRKRVVLLVSAGVGFVVLIAVLLWSFRDRPEDPALWFVDSISGPTVSPSGDRVAFAVCRRGGEQGQIDVRLAILSLGSGHIEHTGLATSVRGFPFSWSSDGATLAFLSLTGKVDHSIEVVHLPTHEVAAISGPSCWSPRFSPDGRRLGFVRNEELIVRDMASAEERVVAWGVNHWYWCWASDGNGVFFVREKTVFSTGITPQSVLRVLYTEPSTGQYDCPEHLTLSPDGTRLGFYRTVDHSFNAIDLQTDRVVTLFHCDHFFIDFRWCAEGIVYLDAYKGERRGSARLMVYDVASGKSRELTVGPIAAIAPLPGGKVLARFGNKQLRQYDLRTGDAQLVLRRDAL